MRFHALRAHFKRRLRKRPTWLITLGFTLLFAFFEGLQVSHLNLNGALPWIRSLITPFFIAFGYGFLSPIPWRWTSDDRPRAPILRGILQAALWNMAFISLIVFMDAGLRQLSGQTKLFMWDGTLMRLNVWQVWRINMIAGVPFMSFIGAMIAMGEQTTEEKEATEVKLREAQGILLRGQLSPHVLFNSLNAVAELVRQDPIRAEEALLDLSELYRSLLLHGDKEKASLGEERQLVQRYLSVEQVRLGDRLRLSWNWDEGVDPLLVPPFLLQPLVENALKHGIAGSTAGGDLRIEAREELHGFRIRVSNTGQSTPLVLGTGIGLKNLEARLQLAYGPHAWFTLKTEQPWTVAEIRVQSPELWRHL
jgi:hypothetical protein